MNRQAGKTPRKTPETVYATPGALYPAGRNNMDGYNRERTVANLTTCVMKAKNREMKHVTITLTDAEKLLSAMCENSPVNGEPVEPVPDDILNCLGWHDMQDCGACGNQLRMMANFCDVCGRPVKRG